MTPPRPIHLLQITDTHLLGRRGALLRGVDTFASLQAVQAHASRHCAQTDGILLTGDLVQDDPAGYALVRDAFQDYSVPVYCVPGNHDLPDSMRAALCDPPFVNDDHVLLGGWLLILLNSWQAGSAGGALGGFQLARLRSLLEQHPTRPTLICLHHQPIPMHSEWLDQVGLKDADALQRCIAAHPQVRGVVWGHVHQALDIERNGVKYMATPATCVQFLPRSPQFAVDSRPPGYRTLMLQPDGNITTEVIWLQGTP